MLRQLVPAMAGVGLLPSAATTALPSLGRAISGWGLYSREKRAEVGAQLRTNDWHKVEEHLSQQWAALSKEDKAEYNRRGKSIVTKPPTSWNLFVKERSPKLRAQLLAGAEGDFSHLFTGPCYTEAVARNLRLKKQLSAEWRAMSDADRQVYKDQAEAAGKAFMAEVIRHRNAEFERQGKSCRYRAVTDADLIRDFGMTMEEFSATRPGVKLYETLVLYDVDKEADKNKAAAAKQES